MSQINSIMRGQDVTDQLDSVRPACHGPTVWHDTKNVTEQLDNTRPECHRPTRWYDASISKTNSMVQYQNISDQLHGTIPQYLRPTPWYNTKLSQTNPMVRRHLSDTTQACHRPIQSNMHQLLFMTLTLTL